VPPRDAFVAHRAMRTRMGVLVAAGQDGVGASVTAALLAREAQSQGARVLLVGPARRPRASTATSMCAAASRTSSTPT
jgi:hypothetical protein